MTRSPLLRQVVALALPVQILFATFLLLRGHDAPGGGFVAGLVTAAAVVLTALTLGRPAATRALGPIVRPLPALGLAVALGSGLVAVARGESFLTHDHDRLVVTPHLAITLSTTLIFDVGVYLVVVGVTTVILATLAKGPTS